MLCSRYTFPTCTHVHTMYGNSQQLPVHASCLYFLSLLPVQVWPYLLGLYPVSSTHQEREAILERVTRQYNKVLSEWRQVEATKEEIVLEAVNGHRVGSSYSREVSPTLSLISPSPRSSPDRSHDMNGLSCDVTRDQPCARLDDAQELNGDETHPSLRNQAEPSHDQEDQSHDQTQASPSPCQSPSKQSDEARRSESPLMPPGPEELVFASQKLSSQGKIFAKELFNIDKDIPRCDRDFW